MSSRSGGAHLSIFSIRYRLEAGFRVATITSIVDETATTAGPAATGYYAITVHFRLTADDRTTA